MGKNWVYIIVMLAQVNVRMKRRQSNAHVIANEFALNASLYSEGRTKQKPKVFSIAFCMQNMSISQNQYSYPLLLPLFQTKKQAEELEKNFTFAFVFGKSLPYPADLNQCDFHCLRIYVPTLI